MADWRAMSPTQFKISEEKIQAMLFGERAMEVLTEALFNQLLQVEMTEHLGAASGEQTKKCWGYRNGSYKRKLTLRVCTLCAGIPAMEVPRDREGTFETELFESYQLNEKVLVLALMEMVSVDLMRSTQGLSTRKVKKITDELCGRRFSRQTVSRLAQKLDGQVEGRAEAGGLLPLPHCPCDAGEGPPAAGRAVHHRDDCRGDQRGWLA